MKAVMVALAVKVPILACPARHGFPAHILPYRAAGKRRCACQGRQSYRPKFHRRHRQSTGNRRFSVSEACPSVRWLECPYAEVQELGILFRIPAAALGSQACLGEMSSTVKAESPSVAAAAFVMLHCGVCRPGCQCMRRCRNSRRRCHSVTTVASTNVVGHPSSIQIPDSRTF